jgi:LAO/AO transport system kinase
VFCSKQVLKKGVMEMADLIVVNKADGELLSSARRTESAFINALQLVPPKTMLWKPPVSLCSAEHGTNIEGVWKIMENYHQVMLVSVFFFFYSLSLLSSPLS